MKHFTKLFISLVLACTLLLCGCSLIAEKEKTFTKEELSITLTNRFYESEQEGFDLVLASTKAAMFALREEFSEGLGSSETLDQYAQAVIDANELENVETQTKDGLTYFVYRSDVDGDEYTYYAFVYKADSAFWLIQFACESKKADGQTDNFFKYAKSVSFQ